MAVRQGRQLGSAAAGCGISAKAYLCRLIGWAALRRRMIYNMCTQKPPHDYSEQLYSRYRDAFNIYINETVRR